EEGTGGSSRYRMLAVIREFGLDRLRASGKMAATRSRLAHYYLGLAESVAPRLRGSDQEIELQILDAEGDNLREALHVFEATGDAEPGLSLAAALHWYWWQRGLLGEAQQWFGRTLAVPMANHHSSARARALNGAGYLASSQGHMDTAIAYSTESLGICQ